MDKKRILIIGGGFGGVRTALDLDKKLSAKGAEINLVDRNNFHLFLPDLYEIGSAMGNFQKSGEGRDQYEIELSKTVNIPFAEIFEGTKVKFEQAEITGIDLEKKEATSKEGKFFSYDYLVLGLGAETETFGIPGVEEHAYKFKTMEEVLLLNKKINQAGPSKIIVVGGGFNGIELAAELACCVKNLKKLCEADVKECGLKIIEAMPQILPMVSERERGIIKKRLGNLKIEVLENSKIAELGPNFIQLADGQKHQADFIIWTAGIRASSFLKNIFGLRLDERGKMIVNSSLQAEGWFNVFGIGDNTVFIDPVTKKSIPGLAYVAADEGKVVAENISRSIKNKPLKSYQPFYSVWVTPVGGKFAVAHLTKNLTISGFWGWIIRELIDLRYFLSILPVSKAISLLSEEMTIFTKND